jgi:GNAT superfamily N-acetyltransferase
MRDFEHVLGPLQSGFYRDRLSDRGAVLSAWLDGRLAGAICVSLEPAEEWILRLILRGVPLLYRLQVHTEHRRQGIGAALVDAAEDVVHKYGCRRVAVGVDDHNPQAARLYDRLGYRRWRWLRFRTAEQTYYRMYVKRLATT